ncbi:VWA domain-containing protein [Streptomyces sp. Ac-502]|uniref:vWA domain-containing protein n=1 Tax=Streptomyces sp. Ac-502 TaxID=3342801 RepID=UPI00386247E2
MGPAQAATLTCPAWSGTCPRFSDIRRTPHTLERFADGHSESAAQRFRSLQGGPRRIEHRGERHRGAGNGDDPGGPRRGHPGPRLPRDPAVPTARTAPADPPAASLPAQATRPDTAPSAEDSASDLVSQAFDAPKATREAEGEPTAAATATEAAAETAAEAEAKRESEAAHESEPKPEGEAPEAKPEPVVEAKPEPVVEAKPEAVVEPKPVTEAEPVPAADAKPEPEVTTEAQPKTQPEPVTEAAQVAAPEPVTGTDPTSAPTSLTKVEAQAPALVSLYKAARVSLEKQGLATQRAAVYLVLDRSGSMRNYYKDGTVQHLAEQALGLSANLDDDGTVPVVFFSTDVDGTADLDLANYAGRIEELHAGLGHMGRTNYHWAINAVIEHYEKSGATDPAFVIFQTDGAPTSKPAAEKALCEAAKLPIFWQFVGFGDPDAKGFDFLRKLDDLAVPEKRVVDNAGFFHAGRDPRALADADLYQQLMVEFPAWLQEARTAGILPS